ncbi:MAG: ABC exporter membrane fusion protein [Richelia sp. RM2_1_2]|nr:ABC exporter membrane fusion protein [Richelia sp. SM1_7_0]NJN08270.1 ABC exporter membrane fusion protein [Richelia sp. RM1_1_1]NJO26344.1 ABC exporter membrane fusion protein [Richelia sp. SL_2_1]NJO57592.1 ABC exporter membrane fusion protein [Richelia sp. RM2_1_2]
MVVTKDKKPENSLFVQPANAPKQRGSKKFIYWVAGVILTTFLGAGSVYVISQIQTRKPTPVPTTTIAPITQITALGRLQPQGEVIKLSVAYAQDSRVNKLLVNEGDRVKAGQTIAILQGTDKKLMELTEAEKNLAVAQAKFAKIKAGEAKLAEINAQEAIIARTQAQLKTETVEKQAAIARAKAQLQNAEASYKRYQALHLQGAIATADFDNKREAFKTAQANLEAAQAQLQTTVSTLQKQIQAEKATLEKLKEVRPVDVKVAQAEVEKAAVLINRVKAELEDFYVRSPVAGQILKINTRVGEQVNTSQGIVELGRTQQMYAIAEIYETDVSKIQVGQRASIISEHGGFAGTLHGTIDHIGLQIKKQDILDSDPAADKDARVVEVKVKLDPEDTPKVAGLTNLQVRVTVNLE